MSDHAGEIESLLSGEYSIERELGGGGMSRVFVAEEKRLGRRVVIKVLTKELAAELSAERFEREVKLAARLQHPHIVPLLTAGEAGSSPYYTMPFVRGESLRAKLASSSAAPRVSEAVPILRQIAAALAYAHDEGVIHRDIKPENILISGGFALVADFGIAKAISAARTQSEMATRGANITQVGTSLGTPAYMAPEQALGDEVDQRADIYAWGVIAYEYLTGAHPFAGKTTSQQLIAAHIAEAPRPITEVRHDITPALAAVVMRALEKNPSDRQQRAREIVEALEDPALLGTTPSSMNAATKGIAVSRTGVPFGKMIVGIAAAAALMLVAVFLFRGRSTPPASAGVDAPINTIAVLPFANTGGDTQDEYFSDGMTDELARALSKMPKIQVASRTSSYAFKGKAVTAQEIGKALNVGGVVEGTVRRAGNRLRVTAQLTNAATGLVMWTDGFERPASNVFEVQDDLTKAIVAALTPALGGTTASAVAAESRGTTDPLAYDLYLRGRFEWNKRTVPGIKEGIKDFERAVALDPKFARAYAALSSSYAVLPEYAVGEISLDESLRQVQVYSSKALALDSTLAEPHAALGLALEGGWKWADAEAEFKKAIALEPSFPSAHQWYGFILADQGRLDEALAQVREARRLDPLSTIIADNLCFREAWVHHFDLAEPVCNEASAAKRHDGYGFYSLMRARYDTAAAEWRSNGGLYSSAGLAAFSLAKGGRRAEAQAALRELEKKIATDPLSVAGAYFGLGEPDKAFPLLERALDLRLDGLRTYYSPISSPIYDDYRSDPRFRHVVERMGLTPYAGNLRRIAP